VLVRGRRMACKFKSCCCNNLVRACNRFSAIQPNNVLFSNEMRVIRQPACERFTRELRPRRRNSNASKHMLKSWFSWFSKLCITSVTGHDVGKTALASTEKPQKGQLVYSKQTNKQTIVLAKSTLSDSICVHSRLSRVIIGYLSRLICEFCQP
jgi:hypothetical protein